MHTLPSPKSPNTPACASPSENSTQKFSTRFPSATFSNYKQKNFCDYAESALLPNSRRKRLQHCVNCITCQQIRAQEIESEKARLLAAIAKTESESARLRSLRRWPEPCEICKSRKHTTASHQKKIDRIRLEYEKREKIHSKGTTENGGTSPTRILPGEQPQISNTEQTGTTRESTPAIGKQTSGTAATKSGTAAQKG